VYSVRHFTQACLQVSGRWGFTKRLLTRSLIKHFQTLLGRVLSDFKRILYLFLRNEKTKKNVCDALRNRCSYKLNLSTVTLHLN
jgi:hypothetical protein